MSQLLDVDVAQISEPLEDDPNLERRVTFRMLALDILSGIPSLRGSQPRATDFYDAFECTNDPDAVFLARYFDGGSAATYAFHVEQSRWTPKAFTNAVGVFVRSVNPYKAESSTLFEAIKPNLIFERIGRALAQQCPCCPGPAGLPLIGSMSRSDTNYWNTLRGFDPHYHAERRRRDASAQRATAQFLLAAKRCCANNAARFWSPAREFANQERVEILRYPGCPGTTLLIHFKPRSRKIDVLVCIPYDHTRAHDAILDGVLALIAKRGFESKDIKPHPDKNAPERLPQELAFHQLGETLSLLRDNRACVHWLLGDAEQSTIAHGSGNPTSVWH